ncbi:MAG TPA: antitoxin VapB family protein [Bacteroidia bacterium]|nr:antitoxin VapB family protein [Bacteroidia bacterium]
MVALSNDAYEILAKAKLGSESFSNVVKRLADKKKGSLTDLAGKWVGGSDDAKKVYDDVLQERRSFTKLREFKL